MRYTPSILNRSHLLALGLAALGVATPLMRAAEVGLSWNAPALNVDGSAVSDIAGYKLYFGCAGDGLTECRDLGSATSTTVADLETGTTYEFAVTTYNAAGTESALSTCVFVTAVDDDPIGLPPEPTITGLTHQPGGGFTLRWTSQPGKVYSVDCTDDLRSGFTCIASGIQAAPPENSFVDPTPPTGARFYRIREG